MKKNKIQVYKIPESGLITEIRETLKKEFHIHEHKTEADTVSIYDTFDWRLFHSNFKLVVKQNSLTLSKLFNDSPILIETISEQKDVIHLNNDSPLLKIISPHIKMRALIHKATVKVVIHRYSMQRENQEKIFLEINELATISDPEKRSQFLIIKIPEDSDTAFESFLSIIKGHFNFKPVKQDIYFHIFSLYNIKPGKYSGKFIVKLMPHMTTEAACRFILNTLCIIITQNEEGIKNDIDPEFLHDFRVAIRRTRSLLTQIKKVFPKELLKKFKTNFKYYAKLTNAPRDTDVYLLKFKDFEKLLPPEMKSGLIPLQQFLQEKHTEHYTLLKREMESEQYNTLIKEWDHFLNTPLSAAEKPSGADTAVLKTAKRAIRIQYQQVIGSGMLIREDSPPGSLHSLRIECKKLRYLLEFFISLFPGDIMKKIISGMKILQDNLGTYQDLQIQQEMLLNFLKGMKARSTLPEETEKAISFLTEYLKNEEKNIRLTFYSIFNKFNTNEIRSYFVFICGQDSRENSQ